MSASVAGPEIASGDHDPSPAFRRIAVLLGLIVLTGGLGIDMYLPLLPRMADELSVPIGDAQLTLTAFILALAIGQIGYGPLSDRLGRRPPLLAGMLIYVIASFGCASAQTIEALLAWRFLQGIGASGLIVVAQAVIRDMATGPAAIRLLSVIVAISGLAPVVSPLIGGAIDGLASWRWLFAGLGIAGCPGLYLIVRHLPETATARSEGSDILPALTALLRDRRFAGLAILPGLTQASTFAFVASSAFLFVELLGLTPPMFGVLFGATSLLLVGSAQLSGRMVERFGTARVVTMAISVHFAAAVILLLASLADRVSLPLACGCFFMIFSMIGMIGSPVTVAALEPHGRVAGAAAALIGSATFAFSALGSHLASVFNDGTTTPLAVVMTSFAGIALATALFRFSRQGEHP